MTRFPRSSIVGCVLACMLAACRPEAAPGVAASTNLWLERRLLDDQSQLQVDPRYRERAFRGLVRMAIGDDQSPDRVPGRVIASISDKLDEGKFDVRRAVLLRGETRLRTPELQLGKSAVLAFDTARLRSIRNRDFFRPQPYLRIDVHAKTGVARSFAIELDADTATAWRPHRVSLAAFAGQTVTIDLALGGELRDRDDHTLLGDLALYSTERPAGDERQNVVLIWLDKTRADLLEQAGASPKIMPAFNGLAKQGVSFTAARSNSNLTHRSTMQALLSSLYTELFDGERLNDPRALPTAVPSLSRLLAEHGWYAANLGTNVHVTRIPDGVGSRQNDLGFDYSKTDLRTMKGGADKVLFQEQVEPWIEGELREPFLLNVHYNGAHEPYPSIDTKKGKPDSNWDVFMEKANGDVVGARYVLKAHRADNVLHRTIEALRKRGVLDRTLIVVLADHGTTLGLSHDFFQWKMRWDTRTSHPSDFYEEQVHVPLVFLHPSLRPHRVDQPVALLDLAPTVLEFLGVPVPPSFEGRSLLPALQGKDIAPERAHVMVDETQRAAALLEYPWKFSYAFEPLERWYFEPGFVPKSDYYMVDVEDRLHFEAQLASYREQGARIGERVVVQDQLYNLESDPNELNNLAASEPEITARMREQLTSMVMSQRDSKLAADEARQVLAFAAAGSALFTGQVSSPGVLKLGNAFGDCKELKLEQVDRHTVRFQCRAGQALSGFELYRRQRDALRFEVQRDGQALDASDFFFGADGLPDPRAQQDGSAVLLAPEAMPKVSDSGPSLVAGTDEGAFFFRLVGRDAGSGLGGERLQRAFAAWGYGR